MNQLKNHQAIILGRNLIHRKVINAKLELDHFDKETVILVNFSNEKYVRKLLKISLVLSFFCLAFLARGFQ